MNEQTIWLREEISIADDLMSYADGLREDFLKYHQDFLEGDFKKGIPFRHKYFEIQRINGGKDSSWKTDPIKYHFPEAKMFQDRHLKDKAQIQRYPTASLLTRKYNNVCTISTYSILESDCSILRHTGSENRQGKYIRIHIPLIVPEGDIFFEVDGVEITWNDLFGFNNQFSHSAHNKSDKRRLVYLIDIERKFLGIPDGSYWTPEREKAEPFVRGKLPKIFHTKEKI